MPGIESPSGMDVDRSSSVAPVALRCRWEFEDARQTLTSITWGPIKANAQGLPQTRVIVATATNQLILLDTHGKLVKRVDTNHASIYSMCTAQVAKLDPLASQPLYDLIIGDTNGTLAIYSNMHLVSREQVGSGTRTVIQCVTTQHAPKMVPTGSAVMPAGQQAILVGDTDGNVSHLYSYQLNWKLNLGAQIQQLLAQHPFPGRNSLTDSVFATLTNNQAGPIQGMVSATVPPLPAATSNPHSQLTTTAYTFVITRLPLVCVLVQQTLVLVIPLPAQPTTLCKGRFVLPQQPAVASETPAHQHSYESVLVGCSDGSVYLLDSMVAKPWFSCPYALTQMVAVPRDNDSTDWIVCAGHNPSLYIYHDRACVQTHRLNDWPMDLAVGDIDGDGRPELLILQGTDTLLAYSLVTERG
ncbi:hypothetical protein H4R35_000723 [Dimargaris xerosporica]|nr:hypothetical protein H4R35_000723 [Dimargaris xerosporica]